MPGPIRPTVPIGYRAAGLEGPFGFGLVGTPRSGQRGIRVGAFTSTMAIYDPPSGTSRIVAGPRTAIVQPTGATKVLPETVTLWISAARRSGFACTTVSLELASRLVPVFGGTEAHPEAASATQATR